VVSRIFHSIMFPTILCEQQELSASNKRGFFTSVMAILGGAFFFQRSWAAYFRCLGPCQTAFVGRCSVSVSILYFGLSGLPNPPHRRDINKRVGTGTRCIGMTHATADGIEGRPGIDSPSTSGTTKKVGGDRHKHQRRRILTWKI